MIEQFKDDTQRKNKKKKHHRSRSRSQHKKHKRSRSRSEHKKDKKKKQKSSHDRHRNNRSSSNDNYRSKHDHKDERPSRLANLSQENPSLKRPQNQILSVQKNPMKNQKYDDESHRSKDKRKSRDRDDRKSRDRIERKSKDRYQRQRESKQKDRDQKRQKDPKQKDRDQKRQRENLKQKGLDQIRQTDNVKQKDRKNRDQKDKDYKDRDYKDKDYKDRDRKQKDKDRREKSQKEIQNKQREIETFGSSLKQDKKANDKPERQNRQNRQKRHDPQRSQRHNRSRQRSYDKEKRRQTSKYDRHDREDKHESRRRQRQTFRSRSNERRQRSPLRNQRQAPRRRSRSKDMESRNDRWRGQRRRDNNRFDAGRFRFDSPPKSDESDMSDDPEKMEKLNRMKAEKELVTSKADRKLYLGNLPPNITSQQLMDMLNTALKKMEINTDIQGDSIISAWISPDGVGHYAFVEFRTAQEATNGLALNGASLFGYQLKLGRPKQYIEYNKQLLSKFGSDSSIDTIIKKVQAMGGELSIQVTQKIICPPTRILVMKHIVTVEELAIDEEYQQIFDDVQDMAKRFGDVIKVVIPRPHEVFDLQEVRTRVKGLGYIFVEYKTVEQAIFARKQFVQKQFSGRSVACSFFNEKRFKEGEYDVLEKVIIDF